MAKEIELGLKATISFTEMDEGGNKENGVGVQIADPNLVVGTEALEEWMHRNPKPPLKEVFENNDLTSMGVGEALSLRSTPSGEGLLMQPPGGDEVLNGVTVAF